MKKFNDTFYIKDFTFLLTIISMSSCLASTSLFTAFRLIQRLLVLKILQKIKKFTHTFMNKVYEQSMFINTLSPPPFSSSRWDVLEIVTCL